MFGQAPSPAPDPWSGSPRHFKTGADGGVGRRRGRPPHKLTSHFGVNITQQHVFMRPRMFGSHISQSHNFTERR
jgi:hypothetical protein